MEKYNIVQESIISKMYIFVSYDNNIIMSITHDYATSTVLLRAPFYLVGLLFTTTNNSNDNCNRFEKNTQMISIFLIYSYSTGDPK